MTTARESTSLSLALMLALLWIGVFATDLTAQGARGSKLATAEGNPDLMKVSSHLLEARRLARQGRTARQIQSAVPVLRMDGDSLEVEVRLKRLTPATVAQMEQLGIELRDVSYQHARIVALLPPELLDELAAFSDVAVIHPNYGAVAWTGSVDNQADVSIRADLARSTFAVDGTGLTIGVLSDSFHDVIGGSVSGAGCARALTGSTSQTSGDLPASVGVLDSGPGGGADEGAGMAELIHDLAPGSPLMFHSAFNSIADFADGITELRTCGADVIVDDVFYFAEPMFQDGLIAQAAQAAVDAGVPYFSSAGNSATFGVDQMFLDSDPADRVTFGDSFHDFPGADSFAAVTVPAGCGIRLVLQWNDPFDGTLGPGATNDLDLYLCTSPSPGACSFFSAGAQGCSFGPGVESGDPLEIVAVTNSGMSPATIYAAVDHFCGNEAERFRIAVFGSGCGLPGSYAFEAGIFDQPQVYGHAAAAGANAVAAVFYGEIDFNGAVVSPLGQIDVESFSSLGGDLPFYFDGSGSPLAGAPVTRFKPEIAAPDGTNTTFFGSDIGFDLDSDPNFFGTSAAAPHAAAVGALMLEASPNLTPAGMTQVLAASALDIETAGVDDLSGYGLTDALDAVQTVSPTGTGCSPNLDLHSQDIAGTQFFRACDTITVGPDFQVTGTGDLTLRAGQTVVLKDGFSVASGGTFKAEIDPAL